jgi:pimeloyl-ACP methyl ester carboxylesterase
VKRAAKPNHRRPIWLRRCVLAALVLGLIGTSLLLWIARTQAHAMFRFVDEATAVRTTRPEHLTVMQKAKVIVGGVTVPRPRDTTDPLKTHRLAFSTATIDNGRGHTLAYWKIEAPDTSPAAPLALLFHGYAASKESLLPAALQLRQLGCECWLVDFFGSGDSTGDHTTFGWLEAHDVDVVARMAHKGESNKEQPRPVILYGVSMGGSAVMRALAELDTPADGAIIESVFHNLRGTVAQRFQLMKLPAFPAADLLLWFAGRELDFDARKHNPLDFAPRIQTPTLLLHGSHDTRAPVDKAQEIRIALAGQAEMVEFDAAHHLLANKNPDLWRQSAATFLLNLPSVRPVSEPQ